MSPEVVTPALLRAWPLPEPGSDKQASGRLLVLGGSTRSPGAVRLAGEAALRAGAGKVAVATVASVVPALAPLVPEAAMVPLASDADGAVDVDQAADLVGEAQEVDVLLAGPGFVDAAHAVRLLEGCCRRSTPPWCSMHWGPPISPSTRRVCTTSEAARC